MASPEVIVRYVADLKQLQAASGQIGAQGSKVGGLAKKGLIPATAALGLIAVAGKKATDAASALNEQVSAATVIFGKNAKGVVAWSDTLAQSAGLSSSEGLKAANAYGNMFTTMGIGVKDATGMSKQMVQLAGDMASFNDQDPSTMLDALRSGLSGEAEPLKKFGVAVSDARVKQFAYQEGIAKVGTELTEQQKLQARYGLIMKDTAKQQGNFADTSGELANQQRINAAETENASAAIGQSLVPVMSTLQSIILPVIQFLGKYPAVLLAVAAAVGILAAAVIILNIASAAGVAITLPIAGIVLGIVVAIAALIAIGILLVKNWDRIKEAAGRVWQFVKDGASKVLSWLRSNWPKIVAVLAGPLGIAVLLIVRHWDKIKQGVRSAISFVKDQFNGLVGFFRNLVGKVGGVVRDIVSAITRPLNAVIGALNAVKVPQFTFAGKKLPGPIPDIPGFTIGPFDIFPGDIPRLAAGGIVTRPTLALLGEAGPEAVVPLGAGGAAVRIDTVIIREDMDVDRLVSRLSAALAVRA